MPSELEIAKLNPRVSENTIFVKGKKYDRARGGPGEKETCRRDHSWMMDSDGKRQFNKGLRVVIVNDAERKGA